MFGQSDSNDYQPFGYLGRIPLYLTTILILVYVMMMVALALLGFGNAPEVGDALTFNSAAVREHYQIWRFFTYPVVNGPTLWFAFEMYLLYAFGREVERFIGRRAFGMLYLSLVVLTPCLLMAISTFEPLGSILGGSTMVNFAVFIAFATIYPNVEIFFTIKAKWIAAIILGIESLAQLKDRAIIPLFLYWATCLLAFLFIKYLRGHIQFRFSLRDYLRRRHSQGKLRPLPKARPTLQNKPPAPHDDVIESIDPLLDKIAKHGIASLTPREREKLEAARAELLKKEGL